MEKIATALDVPVSILFDKSQTNEATITCPHCGKSIHLKTELEKNLLKSRRNRGQRIAKSEIKNRKSLRKQKNYGVIIL